jgi:two-component system chemotaxis sensor kinase CheA
MASRRSRNNGRSKAQREFVSEAEELLERMQSNLADLEDQGASGREVDPDLLNGLFRSAHSLKGLAGMFGHEAISSLAHHLEDALDALRLGRATLGDEMVAVLRESVSEFAELLGSLGDAEAERAAEPKVRELVERIEAACHGEAPAEHGFDSLTLDPALLRALTEYEEHRLRENLRRSRTILLVEATFEILSFDEGLAELGRAVREVGELISTLPSPGEAPESQIRFALLVASDVDADTLRSRLDFPHVTVRRVSASPSAGDASATPAETSTPEPSSVASPSAPAVEGSAVAESEPPPVPSADEPPSSAGDGSEIESLRSISETVRVDIRKLDDLMNLVGELGIQRGSLASIAARLAADSATARVGAELAKVHKVIDRKLKELQAGVLDVRMVPLRQVFEKISRVVRRLRRDLDKDVRLDFKGADTELDKLIVEELIDPLMHLVRNAFDHAIEPVEERLAAGKPAQGSIHIEAFQRGNHVVIEVADDGRGIDRAQVRRRAEALGFVAGDALLSAKETLDLLFTPGFSTREEVSETSGRGVGLDVVRSNLTSLGGIVDIESTLGRGTKITLTLPITLAIIQALIVLVRGQRYAIPLNTVLETMLVDPGEIQRSEGRELLNLRGDPLPLRRLSEEFGLGAPPADAKQYAVVIGLGDLRLGLLVDALDGQRDTVIKAIQGPVQQVRGIAGATELGDQGAILVIDVSSIAEDAIRRREAA